MRALLRYLLISGLVVGVACGLFVVRVGDRSLFGHLRNMTGGEVGSVIEQIKDDLDDRLEDLREANSARPQKKQAAKPALAKVEKKKAAASAQDRQVVLLREAAETAKKMKPVGAKKTRVDERMSPKALDPLLRAN